MWRSSGNTLQELIQNLATNGVIKSKRAIAAMLKIDRKLYCSEETQKIAYTDNPLPIGYGVTISAPHMHAHCLDLLDDYLKPGMRALDVGSGSGYLVACMAQMVHSSEKGTPSGKVYGVEYLEPIYKFSLENLQRDPAARDMLKNGEISVKHGDGWKGFQEGAPFNAIHVGAAAATVPKALIEQLASPGRMVIPVGDEEQSLLVVDKDKHGNITQKEVLGVRYVPLVNPSKLQ